ncbi:ABC transporter permease protein amino terminal extension PA5075.N / ABC transporter, permease protein (cluster 3, basic aa/glutamine/opines) [Olavius sp. associated proteobacterium Delta 1]|nr:ABC transporter permease protein amino terminal extension PA5075.N / ABC transporter, permease protein (cluster 3, basic aa/glutamine/opines) [Olavius sp. associated proteobacterium Delta 1]
MSTTINLSKFTKPRSYYIWVGVFILVILLIAGAFYYATQKVEYIWRWNRVPIYFIYQDEIEIISDIDGDIESVKKDGDDAVVTVKGLHKVESYVVPADGLKVAVGGYVYGGESLAEYKQWKPGLLIIGLWLTLKISVIATIGGILIGVIGGLTRISSNPALKGLTIIYVELIRGSPLMVQILIWYFVLGTVINDVLAAYGLGRLPAFWYGAASLACFAGAYVTEIVRAGIQSIHRGQTEAARSLGMSYAQSMRYIILPQALRRILPPLAGQFISLIKDSSLLGIIAIRDLTKAAREIVSASLQPFEVYLLLGALYLVLTFSLSMLVQYMERRMAIQ